MPSSNILVVTHADYSDLVKKELPELTDSQILLEPSRQNTAPCIAYAAFKINEMNPTANFVVAPSDHLILKEIEFLKRIDQGLDYVSKNKTLLTLGIKPSNPNTGYGYIHFESNKGSEGIYPVINFTEKPDLKTARSFLESGEHLWNAGIFVWNVNTLLDAYKKFQPLMYSTFEEIKSDLTTESERETINRIYPTLESISVDYAIMENADNICTLPADIGWSDIGTWGALYEILDKNEEGNAVLSSNKEQVITENSQNCLIRSTNPDKLLVLGELNDYIVVDEDDVLIVYPKKKEQDIKPLLKEVEKKFGSKFS